MALGAAIGRTTLIAAAFFATAATLYVMGRVPICTCGTIEFWHANANDSGTSQHLTDIYTFTHVLHGFIFYFVLWLIMPFTSVWTRLVLAVFIECGWEIAENTDFVINRYRAATVSLNYTGDSIVNSLGDILSMAIGFIMAAVLPAWATVALALISEAGMVVMIRDNLTLNILMLLHPIEAVKAWQAGAPAG
jgi:Protein of unknown function (DUF2585)